MTAWFLVFSMETMPGTVTEGFTYLVTSGDVGFYDTEGYFYIVDRLKEIIKYKGFQVIFTILFKVIY